MPTPLSRSLNYKLEYIFRKWYEFKKISNGPRFRHSVLWKKRFRHSILWKKKVQAFDSWKEKVQPFQNRCVEKYIILILWFPSSAVSLPLPHVSPHLSTAPWPDLAPSPSGRLLRHLATHRIRTEDESMWLLQLMSKISEWGASNDNYIFLQNNVSKPC